MALIFDATLKSLLAARPQDMVPLFGLPSGEPLSTVNVDLSTLSAATDVAIAIGDPVRQIVDLNIQSGPDPALAARLHIYNAVLNHRFEVPVRSLLMLLRPKADHANLTGNLTYGEDPSRVEFGYDVIRLWQEPVEPYLHAGLTALPLAILCRMPDDRPLSDSLREVVLVINERLQKEASDEETGRLLKASVILSSLRVGPDESAIIFRGVTTMEVMTAFDQWEAEMERKELMARISGKCELLLQLGQKRFGAPDSQTERELMSVRDPDRLKRLADAILTAGSWHELQATP